MARSASDDSAILCVLLVLCDVMFGHNWPGKGDTSGELIESDSPGGRTGAKSDVYDCLLIVCVSEYAVC